MPGILDVAAAGEVSIADAADVASSAMNQFGLQAKDMGRIGDALVKAGNMSSTGVNEIGASLKNAGVAAAGAGIDLEKTTAIIASLANAGVKGGEAGTALRAMILRLQAPNAKAKSALKFLGIDTKDKQGNLRPIEELLAEIDKKADAKFGKDKNGNRRAALLKGIFEDEAYSAANILTAQAGSGELAKVIEANYKSAGTASKMAKVMSDNAAGAMANYESAVEELQLTIGEKLIPKVTELFKWADEVVTKFAAWAAENPGLVTALGYTAGAIVLVSTAVWAGTTAATAAMTAWGGLTAAWGFAGVAAGGVTKALNVMKLAMLSNPITAILVGVATAAVLIYENWEPISQFFSDLWGGIKDVFGGVWDWILDKIEWVGGKIAWLKEDLLGLRAGIDFSEVDKSLQEQVNKLSQADLEIAATGTNKVAQAAQAKLQLQKLQASAPALIARGSEAASSALSAFSAPADPIVPMAVPLAIPTGKPIPGLDPDSKGSKKGPRLEGELLIKISGAQVEGTQLKTNTGPSFAVRVNTGGQA
jgi:TP901 family phage tail tape measure protein